MAGTFGEDSFGGGFFGSGFGTLVTPPTSPPTPIPGSPVDGSLSDFAENKLLEHSLGRKAWTKPAAVYMALYIASPTDATGGAECGDTGYERQAVTWGPASNGAISNDRDVIFGPTNGNASIIAFGILDKIQRGTGNLIWYGPLTIPQNLFISSTLTFESGTITVSLD